MGILAFDTSNYTTSTAFLQGNTGFSSKELLKVPSGSLGLRQQEALFQHIKALPFLLEQLKQQCDLSQVSAIGVSTKPRETEDSYMPCFLAGENMGKAMATLLGVPCYELSHQQGHFAAALWALEKLSLMKSDFLAWHISGGTTELLLVKPKGNLVVGEIVACTSDISAGQWIDRTGQLLGLDFPSGRWVDKLACEGKGSLGFYKVKVNQGTPLQFSLSGMENKVEDYVKQGQEKTEICGFVLDTLADVLGRVTLEAQKQYGQGNTLPVLYCGGVASSYRLKEQLTDGLFPPPLYATDNAMGVAVLARALWEQETQ